MRIQLTPVTLISLLAGLVLLWPADAPALDVAGYTVLKGKKYSQSDPATPGDTFVFYWFRSEVRLTAAGTVSEASVQLPGGDPLPLFEQADPTVLQFETIGGLTLTDMNQNFPNGNYALAMTTEHDGQRNVNLSLTGDSYPNTPTFLNFAALETVDPSAATTLSWGVFTGGTANDFIQVQVLNADGVEQFSTPAVGAAGALTGTATSVVIPAGTLPPESAFTVTLTFLKVITRNTTSYPGATGVAGYFKSTEASLSTTAGSGGTDTTPPQLVSNFPTNGASGVARTFPIVFAFNEAMQPAQSIAWSANVSPANFIYQWSGDARTLTCSYQGSLPAGVTITWILNPASQPLNFKDTAGNALPAAAYAGSFSTLAATNNPCDPVEDGRGYAGVTKQLTYVQNSAVSPTLDPTNPPVFYAITATPTNNPVTSAKLQVPSGPLLTLTNYFGASFMDWEEYVSQSALDAARPNGTYTLQLTRTTGAPPSAGINLTGSYPPTPQILNYPAAQAIGSTTNFVLQWNGFTGATSADSIGLVLHSGNWTWAAPDPCVPRLLTNTATSITIPAGTLQPGTTYDATLTYSRMTYANSNAIPDMNLAAFLNKTLHFQIRTTGSSGSTVRFVSMRVLPNGSIELKLQGTPGSTYRLQSTTDFDTWEEVTALFAPPDGIMTHVVVPSVYGGQAFFRARSL